MGSFQVILMFHFRSERTAGSFFQKLLPNSQKATLTQCMCRYFPTKKTLSHLLWELLCRPPYLVEHHTQQFQRLAKCWCLQGLESCKQSQCISYSSFPWSAIQDHKYSAMALKLVRCNQKILLSKLLRAVLLKMKELWKKTRCTELGITDWLIKSLMKTSSNS